MNRNNDEKKSVWNSFTMIWETGKVLKMCSVMGLTQLSWAFPFKFSFCFINQDMAESVKCFSAFVGKDQFLKDDFLFSESL